MYNFELIKFFIEIACSVVLAVSAIIITMLIHRYEKNDNIETKTISSLTCLFSEYKDTMKIINKALEEAKNLEMYLLKCKKKGNFSDFNKKYFSSEYDCFRDVHYFYELLGSLLSKKEIVRHTFWHYFMFPIEFFLKTINIRTIIWGNNCLPSYAENFCSMFIYYNTERQKDKCYWIVNGKKLDFDDDKVKYYTGPFYDLKKVSKKDKSGSRNLPGAVVDT
jgi:hypothetical protein